MAKKAKNDSLGFARGTSVAIPTFHENRGKGDDIHGDDSGEGFDVHDNADF